MHHSSKYLFLLLLLMLFPKVTFAQLFSISGRVVESGNKNPISRAQVKIRKSGETQIIAFSQTDKDGYFKIEKKSDENNCILEISCIGYSTYQKAITMNSDFLFIEMEQKDTQLKEVVVSPQKIMQRGDTIRYLVSAFSAANDRTIGDVLKKMPGVEVLENGEIKYQGQKLNKFYIEGSDLLGGRYGLATNNISHKDVSSVEIMENHQPIKALQDVTFSNQPALNIKLKEDAKTRWAGTIKGGAGVPELWEAELFTMRFKRKMQTLNTYKGNNVGTDYFESMVFTSIGDFISNSGTQLPTYINVSPSVANGIGSNRSGFNQTNNLTSNTLFKVGKDFDLVSEVIGSIDQQESEYSSQTTYFLGDDQISVEDKYEDAESLKKKLSGKVQLKANEKKYYFNNNLQFSYDSNDPVINTLGSYSNRQKASVENKKISNDFDLLQRFGSRIVTFRSTNEYVSKPQSLTIYKNNFTPIYQDIDLSSFNSNNSANYSFNTGNIRWGTQARVLFQNKDMSNGLDSITHHTDTRKLKLDFIPTANYDINDFHFYLGASLFYQSISLNKENHKIYGFNPGFSFSWIASSRVKLGSSINFNKNMPDESLFYSGNIMNDYRNLTKGYVDFSTGTNRYYSANIEYKDVIKTLFSNLSVSFSQNQRTKISEQDFINDYILNFYSPANSNTDLLMISGSISKGIRKINGTVSIFPTYIHNESSTVRNGLVIPFQSESYAIKSNIHSKISRWYNVNYNISYSYDQYRMNDQQEYATTNRLSESLKASFYFLKSLQLSFVLDHYCNELNPGNYKNFVFADISSSYLLGNRWEIACAIRNIFDEKYYSYFIENELNTYYQSYKIRPRNILLSATYRF